MKEPFLGCTRVGDSLTGGIVELRGGTAGSDIMAIGCGGPEAFRTGMELSRSVVDHRPWRFVCVV